VPENLERYKKGKMVLTGAHVDGADSNGKSGESKIYISGSKELGEKDLLINAENPGQAALWKKTIDAHIRWINARTSGAVEEYTCKYSP